jgi:FkbM family methyltransferase
MDELVAAARRAGSQRTAVVAGDNVVVSEVNGFIVGVPGEEWRLAAFHTFRGVLEPGLTRRFTESLAPGMTVVDVGANVGMYTLVAARGVAPNGKVYSFEPTPRTFAILKDNIQVNGLLESGIVDLRQTAVTDRRGTARLAVYRDNNGHNTLFAGGAGPEFVDVETVALDDALADVARVDVIKIDAEGAEPLIWNGMTRTLQRNPAVKVFMEFAPSLLSRAGQDPGAFFDRLVADGFLIQRVHDENGALMNETREALCGAFSANVMLTRAVV